MLLAQFSHYWWLAILVIVVMGAGYMFVKKRIVKNKHRFFVNNYNAEPIKNIVYIKTGLLIVGLVFLLIAVWRPQWGRDVEQVHKKGLDIVFSVDVSKSMNALDFSTKHEYISRLDATKMLIENFANKRSSDRLGLVEFAGESFVASPLTLDHTVFVNFLKNISSDDLGKQGTNLADAIEISVARLEVQSETEQAGRAIVLFSDGDETITSDAKKMAQMAADKGIKIYTVGIGSEKGSPIPEGQDAFGQIVYKQYKGETVMTALNPQPLKEIAEITGGEYFHGADASDLSKLSDELDALPKKMLSDEEVNPYKERYFVFALIGTILFVLGFVLPEVNIISSKKIKN